MSYFSLRRYLQLIRRPEKLAYTLIAYSSLTLLLMVILVFPLKDYQRESRENYRHQRDLEKWLLQNQSRLVTARDSYQQAKQDQPTNGDKRTLMRLVSEIAEKQRLKLSRLEQRQTNVTVTFEKQPLSRSLRWLQTLTEDHQVTIEQASLRYTDLGKVSATLTFSR